MSAGVPPGGLARPKGLSPQQATVHITAVASTLSPYSARTRRIDMGQVKFLLMASGNTGFYTADLLRTANFLRADLTDLFVSGE